MSYTLLNDAGGRFALNGSNQLVGNGPFDFETAASHEIIIRVTDAGGLFFDKSFTINIGDVAEGSTITGTAGADSLVGTIGADTILGLGGDDTLIGSGGQDSLVGGSGFDTLVGGGGNDTLDGSDTINGSDFDDDTVTYINEGGANGVVVNLVTGLATDSFGATDTLIDIENVNGTNFADSITGGNAFNDEFEAFRGFGGADTINGGSGIDEIRYESEHLAGGTQGIVANLAAGTIIDTYGVTDTVSNIEFVRGSNFADDITGDGLNNRLRGLRGNDTLNGGGGIDEVDHRRDGLFGGNGAVTVNLATGTATDGFGDTDTLINIENARGTNLGDTLTGSSVANRLRGEGGNDTLRGGAGNDTLEGGDGDDVFTGGAGSDSIVGGAGNNTVDYSQEGGPQGVQVNIGTLFQSQFGLEPDSAIDSFGDVDVVTQIRNVIGTDHVDALDGSDEANLLVGNGGDDNLYGYAGDDTIRGGDGNDRLVGGSGSDSMDGGAGIDRVEYLSNEFVPNNSDFSLNATGWQASIDNGEVDSYANVEIISRGLGKVFLVGNGSSLTLQQATDLVESQFDWILVANEDGSITSIPGNPNFAPTDIAFFGVTTVNENESNIQLGFFEGFDLNHDVLTYSLIDNASGRFSLDGTTLIANSNFNFEDMSSHQITMRVTDSGGLSFDKAFTIQVANVNEAPNGISPPELLLNEDDNGVRLNLLDGANDPDFGTPSGLSISNVQGLVPGMMLDQQWVWIDPSDAAFQSLAFGEVRVIDLTFTISDFFLSQSQTARITITGVNDAPVAVADSGFSTGANTAISIASATLLANDSDIDAGNTLSLAAVGDATNGTVALNAGIVTFTPDAGYIGPASFTYTVSDGQGGSATQTVSLTIEANFLNGTNGADYLVGTDGSDLIEGLGGNDTLLGRLGNDILDGGTGNDSMNGGLGDDTYIVEATGDVVTEGINAGADTILSYVTYTASSNVERLELLGSDNINALGNALGNTLIGNDGNNVLNGAAGLDTMTGGFGDDTYHVDNVDDVVIEGENEGFDTVVSSISLALASHVEVLTLTGTSNNSATGNELDNILNGNTGNNLLNGGGGADTMVGGLGSDTYVVDDVDDSVTENDGEGTDTVQSSVSYALADNIERLTLTGSDAIDGTGNALGNTILGNAASNLIDGGAGNDTMTGGLGDDIYIVESAGDAVSEATNAGNDTIRSFITYTASSNVERLELLGSDKINALGNTLGNTLIGNDGNNLLNGAAGADTMSGGLGDDSYVVDAVGDIVIEGEAEGTDTVLSSVSHTLASHVEVLTLTGTGSNSATGNDLDNILNGNSGNNLLNGSTGADTMAGGLGSDTYVVDDVGDVVTEIEGQGTDTVQSAISYVLGDNIERLTLIGSDAIDGTGNALDNTILGNAMTNLLTGGAGKDTLSGGLGDDIYIVESAGDVVIESANAGNDTIRSFITYTASSNVERLELLGSDNINALGNTLGNTLIGNDGNNLLNGAAGADTMSGGLGDDSYVVDAVGDIVIEGEAEGTDTVLSSVSHTLASHVEVLTLTGTGSNSATGNDLDNILNGNSGNNLLNGSTGADTMAGGLGSDIYVVDDVGDVVTEIEGQGTDTVQSAISYVLGDNIERLTLIGSDAIDGTGNALANTILGNAAANLIDGGAGNDTMTGGLGDDTYIVDATGDSVRELDGAGFDVIMSSVSYVLPSHVERLVLTGSADINATGSSQANTLIGNDGKNLLNGAAGADTMSGGFGDDTYIVDNIGDQVTELADEGVDTVLASISYTLGADLDNLTLTGSGSNVGTGNGLDNMLIGNTGANRLLGHAGNDTLDGLSGNDTLTGGTGDDLFIFRSGGGRDTVADFEAGTGSGDVLAFSFGTAYDTYGEVMAAASQVGAHTVITINGTTNVTLQNVFKADLILSDFAFI